MAHKVNLTHKYKLKVGDSFTNSYGNRTWIVDKYNFGQSLALLTDKGTEYNEGTEVVFKRIKDNFYTDWKSIKRFTRGDVINLPTSCIHENVRWISHATQPVIGKIMNVSLEGVVVEIISGIMIDTKNYYEEHICGRVEKLKFRECELILINEQLNEKQNEQKRTITTDTGRIEGKKLGQFIGERILTTSGRCIGNKIHCHPIGIRIRGSQIRGISIKC